MKNLLSIVLILVSIVLFGLRISKGIQFEQNVEGYLKRATDANTIELAEQELTKAIDYLEANDLTSGYTSILWKTPDEDIDYWYRNLKASQTELRNLKTDSALEQANVLIKLRETLVDVGESTKVNVPDGMSVYPNNALWAILTFIGFIAGSAGLLIPAVRHDRKLRAAAAESNGT